MVKVVEAPLQPPFRGGDGVPRSRALGLPRLTGAAFQTAQGADQGGIRFDPPVNLGAGQTLEVRPAPSERRGPGRSDGVARLLLTSDPRFRTLMSNVYPTR